MIDPIERRETCCYSTGLEGLDRVFERFPSTLRFLLDDEEAGAWIPRHGGLDKLLDVRCIRVAAVRPADWHEFAV